MKILSFGEILWDVYPDQKYIGGAPLNFAAHSAKLGETAYMLSAIGQDELGKEALDQIKKWGISEKYIACLDSKNTGRCLVTLDEHHIPTYNLLNDVAYDYIPCDNVTEDFDVLYFGTLAMRCEYNVKSLQKLLESNQFEHIFIDLNIRPPFYSEQTVRFASEKAIIIKLSLEELPVVSDLLGISREGSLNRFTKSLLKLFNGIEIVIITLGENGAYAYDAARNKEYFCESKKVDVVSTVGAGDSFSAAFLHKYLQNVNIQSCLKYANAVAGLVVSQYGAVPDYNIGDVSAV